MESYSFFFLTIEWVYSDSWKILKQPKKKIKQPNFQGMLRKWSCVWWYKMRSQLKLQKYKKDKVITLWGKALSCGFPSQKSHGLPASRGGHQSPLPQRTGAQPPAPPSALPDPHPWAPRWRGRQSWEEEAAAPLPGKSQSSWSSPRRPKWATHGDLFSSHIRKGANVKKSWGRDTSLSPNTNLTFDPLKQRQASFSFSREDWDFIRMRLR